MKIAIQADGGTEIGMGHVMRTLVLAKELLKENDVFYICRGESKDGCKQYTKVSDNEVNSLDKLEKFEINYSKYSHGIKKILSKGFRVKLINEDNLINELKCINADMLITDSYSVNEDYFHETKKIFRKTTYIDDTNKHNFDVDFLINQNIDAIDFEYKVNDDTKLLLGTKYLLLRDEFKKMPSKTIREKIKDIIITVGGADPYNLTEKVLNYIRELNYNFHIVIGPSFVDTSFVEKLNSDNVKFYHNANMCEIMKKCDMAISACGSTLYELSACGVPTLGIIIAENQNGIASKLNEMGIIKNLGWYGKINKEEFLNSINKLANDYELRKSLSNKASKLVDGKGAERIAKVLCEKI
ncbi:UDP-2,4-diacetamido-2,4,6-trideoxy-beta-L-altropyranose hydrolase [Clostridium beijerinckii]|uniref:UDP-2,4-diacetamido-2,4, 6-trideoxy-beta-L-altropyranose hydrolase n=1 Tax=Clostridium beijerinckii TaxID=1520 RepID=UPI0003D392E6|nr:UDP-2,4-diacetamido-2,4,6-trideoxy-beta-L-altropyranose hydrolase [Clostridium beijerinckii]ALB44534.1 UDP-2,4-diacetamido-2,4,6-trideoxy-beta-L-altropyranose hydrolase [Clostridium beijerinckii NRRL B-598]